MEKAGKIVRETTIREGTKAGFEGDNGINTKKSGTIEKKKRPMQTVWVDTEEHHPQG